VSVPCGVCPDHIGLGAATCPGCGRAVTDRDRAVLQARLEAGDFQAYQRGRRMRNGATWIGVLAILFAIWAPIVYALGASKVAGGLARLEAFSDDETLAPIDGVTYTAGELRAQLQRAPWRAAGLNVALAVLMGGLWLWGRRAPLSAICCALALYVVVQVANALLDPTTIVQGLLIKILALAALWKGLRAALVARAVMRP
jgi:hypothetical protein